MFPVIFSLGPFTLHTYGLLVASALLAGIYTAGRLAPRAGVEPDRVWNVGVYMVLAGLVGAKLLMVVSDWSYYAQNPARFFSLSTLQAGGTVMGGLVLAIAVGAVLLWRTEAGFAAFADVYAPGIALGQAVGRLGCFSAGCCWGKPTEVAWGVTFTNPYSAQVVGVPLHQALHPTQLYESVLSAGIFFLLLWLWKRRRFPGQIFSAYLVLYAVVRFNLEFFRNDPRGPFFFENALSTPQLISLGLFLVGLLFWWQQRSKTVEPQP